MWGHAMHTTGDRTAGMAFLPRWLSADPDSTTLDRLFADWVSASGWQQAGLIGSVGNTHTISVEATATNMVAQPVPPEGWRAIAEELARASESDDVRVSGHCLCTLVHVPGAESALLWVRETDAACDAWDQAYLRLSAQLMQRSRVVLRSFQGVDSQALWSHLQNASTIAGRIAHDFGNILTGVIGFTDLSQPHVPAGSQLESYLHGIAKSGVRGSEFVQQLHQFQRVGQSRTQPGWLSPVLERELRELRHRGDHAVRIVDDIPPDLPSIALGEAVSGIVLRQLFHNAVESMPQGGNLGVRVRQKLATSEDGQRYWGNLKAGPCLEVVISDTGSGISPALQGRLFVEPLLTTKYRHRGLGLATVFRILYLHDAGIRLSVRPAPESGTDVQLLIPLARPESEVLA